MLWRPPLNKSTAAAPHSGANHIELPSEKQLLCEELGGWPFSLGAPGGLFSQFGKKLPELLSATFQVNFTYFTPFGDDPSPALAFLGDASFSRVMLKALTNGEATTSQERMD